MNALKVLPPRIEGDAILSGPDILEFREMMKGKVKVQVLPINRPEDIHEMSSRRRRNVDQINEALHLCGGNDELRLSAAETIIESCFKAIGKKDSHPDYQAAKELFGAAAHKLTYPSADGRGMIMTINPNSRQLLLLPDRVQVGSGSWVGFLDPYDPPSGTYSTGALIELMSEPELITPFAEKLLERYPFEKIPLIEIGTPHEKDYRKVASEYVESHPKDSTRLERINVYKGFKLFQLRADQL